MNRAEKLIHMVEAVNEEFAAGTKVIIDPSAADDTEVQAQFQITANREQFLMVLGKPVEIAGSTDGSFFANDVPDGWYAVIAPGYQGICNIPAKYLTRI